MAVPSPVQNVRVTRGGYQPPHGIPAPGFGIVELPGPVTSVVNNTHPAATDANNPVGTAAKPRRTVPTTLPAGTVVQVTGGPYTIGQVTWTAQGTQASPVFVLASGVIFQAGTSAAWLRTAGFFLVIDGARFLGVQLQVTGIAHSVKNCEVTGAAGSSIAVSPGAAGTVIYKSHIHHNGNSENPVEHDIHGVLVMDATSYTWLLESDVHHNGGDAIQIGQANSPEPWASAVFVGGNTLHQDRENAVDVKKSRDVIVSQNLCYGYVPRSSSNGEIIVIHDGAQRVWVLNNYLTSGVYGVSCTNAVGAFIVGNVIANVYNAGPYDPASLYASSGVMVYNSATVVVSQNTIVGVDSAIAIPILTTGTTSEVVSNVIATVTTAANTIRYGNAGTLANATISHNLVPPTNPQFVGVGDYRLSATSPAKGTGLRSAAHASFTTLYGLTITKDVYGALWSTPPSIGASA